MPTEYVTVFQISEEATSWGYALSGAVPIVAGILLLVGKWRFRWKKPHWILPLFCVCFGTLWTYLAAISTVRVSSQALSAYQHGDFQVVEGSISNFHPMPWEGHQFECFTVQQKVFCYSDYMGTPGFHNAASHGGPIHLGLPVRIAYRGNVILRLDVARDEALTPEESAAAERAARESYYSRK